MQKKKISFDDVVEKWKRDYMGIIFLTIHYQDKQGGLRLLHYRYALVKNDEISEQWKQKMIEFFGWKLNQLYIIQEIKKCITTRQNLVKKIHNLVEWGVLKRFDKNDDRNFPLYRIDTANFNKIDMTIRRNKIKKLFAYTIDHYSKEQLTEIENTIEDYLGIKKPEPLPKSITEEEAMKMLQEK